MSLINARHICRLGLSALVGTLFAAGAAAHGATPGITGPTFNLQANTAYLNQPDGSSVYAWGYGCNGTPGGFAPKAMIGTCSTMQLPAPTLIMTEGVPVSVTLTNNLPSAAGNTSILFPGFNVTAAAATTQPSSCTTTTPVLQGLLTMEVANGLRDYIHLQSWVAGYTCLLQRNAE